MEELDWLCDVVTSKPLYRSRRLHHVGIDPGFSHVSCARQAECGVTAGLCVPAKSRLAESHASVPPLETSNKTESFSKE